MTKASSQEQKKVFSLITSRTRGHLFGRPLVCLYLDPLTSASRSRRAQSVTAPLLALLTSARYLARTPEV